LIGTGSSLTFFNNKLKQVVLLLHRGGGGGSTVLVESVGVGAVGVGVGLAVGFTLMTTVAPGLVFSGVVFSRPVNSFES